MARTFAPSGSSRWTEHVYNTLQREFPLQGRLHLGVKAAHVAPDLLALALDADGRLPSAARRGEDSSEAALVGWRQLELQPGRAARAVKGLVREIVPLATARLAHL